MSFTLIYKTRARRWSFFNWPLHSIVNLHTWKGPFSVNRPSRELQPGPPLNQIISLFDDGSLQLLYLHIFKLAIRFVHSQQQSTKQKLKIAFTSSGIFSLQIRASTLSTCEMKASLKHQVSFVSGLLLQLCVSLSQSKLQVLSNRLGTKTLSVESLSFFSLPQNLASIAGRKLAVPAQRQIRCIHQWRRHQTKLQSEHLLTNLSIRFRASITLRSMELPRSLWIDHYFLQFIRPVCTRIDSDLYSTSLALITSNYF